MCGRYEIDITVQELEDVVLKAQMRIDALGFDEDASSRTAGLCVKVGEVFPTDIAPVLTVKPTPATAPLSKGTAMLTVSRKGNTAAASLLSLPMVWGFPVFPGSCCGTIFNTRIERALASPMWEEAFLKRRCVVPASGFYEWQHGEPRDRARCRFSLPDEPVLYLGGIYSSFADAAKTDSPRTVRAVAALHNRFSILTTAPNPQMACVHNRMPVVLRPDELDEWLYGKPMAFARRDSIKLVCETLSASPEAH
jgi:putative SOS response-associated peptidase YedK